MDITVIITGVPVLVICAGSNFQIESSSTIALQVFITPERESWDLLMLIWSRLAVRHFAGSSVLVFTLRGTGLSRPSFPMMYPLLVRLGRYDKSNTLYFTEDLWV